MDPKDAEELLNALTSTVQRFLAATDARQVHEEWGRLRYLLTREDLLLARLTLVSDVQRRIERQMREILPILTERGAFIDPSALANLRIDMEPLAPAPMITLSAIFRPTLWDRLRTDDNF